MSITGDRVYMEKKYCDDCIKIHWVEILNPGDKPREKIVCHGADFMPIETKTHYVKSANTKGYYLIKKSKLWQPAEPEPLPFIWQMAKDANLPADVDF